VDDFFAQRQYADIVTELAADVSDGEAQWRLARAYRFLAQGDGSRAEKEEYARKALECARKACEQTPDDFNAHKWRGLALSTLGDYLGNTAIFACMFD
jgi:hypothetical protein